MERSARDRPVDLAPSPWPEVESADPLGEIARRYVWLLKRSIGSQSVRSVAARAGLHHATLDAVLSGRRWPDLATIGRLEIALDAQFLRFDVPG